MQSSLKKSLYLGLAALSFASVAAVSTTASAKSYAKAGAYTTLSTKPETRNVEATGTNALYTKPGTVKGAKIVASKKVMGELATSKKSANYFRAYGQKTTNRGSVYYRVVTMDGKYRGYVYGGKTEGTFAGGVKSAETTTKATVPTQTTVYFANPGTKNVTWTAPKYTQYKASKNVTNTTPFAGDKLTITDAATKTREGSLYYYVKDATNPSVSGWIYSKAVTTDSSVAYNQAKDVKVNFSDGTNVVASSVLKNLISNNTTNTGVSNPAVNADAVGTAVGFDAQTEAAKNVSTDTNNPITWATAALKGTGYGINLNTAANQSALLAAKTGDTITLTVTKGDTVVTPVTFYKDSGTGSVAATKLTRYTSTTQTASSTSVIIPLTTGFTGVDGANYTAATLTSFLTTNKVDKLYTPTYTKKVADGTTDVNYYTVYTLKTTDPGTYGANSSANAYYTAEEVQGESPAKLSSDNTGSIVGNDSATAATAATTGTDTQVK